MFVIGILGLVAKLHKWNESAMFFDGTSLGTFYPSILLYSLKAPQPAAYVFGVIVYLSVTISALRTIADPTDEDNRDDQVMALRVLSAGNIIMIGCLALILALQVSRYQETVELFPTRANFTGWSGMGSSPRSQGSH